MMRSIAYTASALWLTSAVSAVAQTPGPTQKVIHQAPAARAPGHWEESPPAAVPVTASMRSAFAARKHLYQFSRLTPEDIAKADQESRATRGGGLSDRVGVVRTPPGGPIVLAPSAPRLQAPRGPSARAIAIQSPDAYGLRLHLTKFDAAAGQVLVYAYDNDRIIVRGPYTGTGPNKNGDFWTPSLPGDTAYVEVTGSASATLEVSEVIHFDQPVGLSEPHRNCIGGTNAGALCTINSECPGGECGNGPGTGELACHLDVMCESSVSSAARDATGYMNWRTGDTVYRCTGTLLNDEDPETYVPYFLTAYHCLHTQVEVSSLEVVWVYQRSSCGGSLPYYFALPYSTGGTLLETSSTDDGNDMSFIRLDSVPDGISFAGWNTETSSAVYGIHHPRGAWKRYVELSGVGICPTCTCVDAGNYDYYDMPNGLVEHGSSGSAAFNSDGQVVGQLRTGIDKGVGCSQTAFACDTSSDMWAIYGEFAETFPKIFYPWLALGGTIYVDWSAFSIFGELGTILAPYKTVTEAYDRAWDGVRIVIAAGSYPEQIILAKQVELTTSGGAVVIGSSRL